MPERGALQICPRIIPGARVESRCKRARVHPLLEKHSWPRHSLVPGQPPGQERQRTVARPHRALGRHSNRYFIGFNVGQHGRRLLAQSIPRSDTASLFGENERVHRHQSGWRAISGSHLSDANFVQPHTSVLSRNSIRAEAPASPGRPPDVPFPPSLRKRP